MNCSDIQEMISAYLDGTLDVKDRRMLEAHAESCGKCRREISEIKATIALLDAVPEMDPPADFVQQVRHRINTESGQDKSAPPDGEGSVIAMSPASKRKKSWINRPALQVAIAACVIGMITLYGITIHTIKAPGEATHSALTDAASEPIEFGDKPHGSAAAQTATILAEEATYDAPDDAKEDALRRTVPSQSADPKRKQLAENAFATPQGDQAELGSSPLAGGGPPPADVPKAKKSERNRPAPVLAEKLEKQTLKANSVDVTTDGGATAPPVQLERAKNEPKTESTPGLIQDEALATDTKQNPKDSEGGEVVDYQTSPALKGNDLNTAAKLTVKLANAAQRQELFDFIQTQNKSSDTPVEQLELRGRAEADKDDQIIEAVFDIPVALLNNVIAFIDGLEKAEALKLEMPGGMVITNNIMSLGISTDSLMLESESQPADTAKETF